MNSQEGSNVHKQDKVLRLVEWTSIKLRKASYAPTDSCEVGHKD